MKRVVQPELLDELPAGDPRAIRSRRDLRRVNWFMGNAGIVFRDLNESSRNYCPRTIVELGAGDGLFMLNIAKRVASRWPNLEVTFVDRQRLVSAKTEKAMHQIGWKTKVVCADVFDWLPNCPQVDVILVNLFLHHFENEKLIGLLNLIGGKTNAFIACEPRRYHWAVSGTKLLWLIGCNEVTRHDALISVRAGFQGKELSKLWPQKGDWKIEESESGLFSHRFAAVRE